MLAYRNDEVVHRFSAGWSVPLPAARVLFADVKRYLWLCGELEFEIPPVRIVDEMWHTFLVFTRDYRTFCESYLGAMVEHVPTTRSEFRAQSSLARRDSRRVRSVTAERLQRCVMAVWDKLGERVAMRWYVDYPERYGAKFFARGYRPSHGAS